MFLMVSDKDYESFFRAFLGGEYYSILSYFFDEYGNAAFQMTKLNIFATQFFSMRGQLNPRRAVNREKPLESLFVKTD
ncbi:hypothetical protein AUJ65_00415 [Candidatus Micrarchaeota archaeon CG1_02_51_15]|nr:MAG: hypothetical protein AUJ65_00415 [Candidatus Micrarchaeota archaeon CG1_02_51_15]